MRMLGPITVAIIATVIAMPTQAQKQPEFYIVSSEKTYPWNTEVRVLVDEMLVMRAVECVARYDRDLQDGKPPLKISINHPVHSDDYEYRFEFNLADDELDNKQVETISVGPRTHQVEWIESRILPWTEEPFIIAATALKREMFRPNEQYPWMPLEFLIPQFFELESITLGISGDFRAKNGKDERRYEHLDINLGSFREAMSSCVDHVNPSSEREREMSAELKRQIAQQSSSSTSPGTLRD